MSDAYLVLLIVNVLWNIGLTVFTYARKPGEEASKAAARIEAAFTEQLRRVEEETDRELADHRAKLQAIKAHMDHMPSSEELAELTGTVGKLDERTLNMSRTMQHTQAGVSRIEDWLLRRGDTR